MATDTLFNGYRLSNRDDGSVDVLDPRYPDSAPLYTGDDAHAAKAWVKAYRNGATWAVLAARA